MNMRVRRAGLALESRLLRQNGILFAGGLTAGIGSFVYHALAGRLLGPAAYGYVAFLIAAYSIAASVAVVLSTVIARQVAGVIAPQGGQSVGPFLTQITWIVGAVGLGAALLIAFAARPIATFEHLDSP